MFRRLQSRLTVLYAALFGVVLSATAGAAYFAVSAQSQRLASDALASTGAVFDQMWELRAQRLTGGATLLSRDFGFREALATRDEPTVASAVANLRERLDVDDAFVADASGAWIAGVGPGARPLSDRVRAALLNAGEARGVLARDGDAYELVSAPIMAPDLKGWIVFAVRLDGEQMRAFSRLSAVPLTAVIAHRDGKAWTTSDAGRWAGPVSAFVAAGVADERHAPGLMDGPRGRALALAKPLPVPDGAPAAALLLELPLAVALAPYRALLLIMGIVGLAGLLMVVAGSSMLARGVTRPLSMLTDAAKRLQEGEAAEVDTNARDEVGDLARGFAAMALAVAERERRITAAARTDAETGLPNRVALEGAVADLQRLGGTPVFVAAYGVDRFARMRGAIGYDLSAGVLQALGVRIAELQPDWVIARTSADIVSVAFTAPDDEAARAQSETVRAALQSAQTMGGLLIDVRLVCGLSSGGDVGDMVREADLALDDARVRDLHFVRFDAEAHARAAESLRLMPELRRAIAVGGLHLVHQPKWDARAGRVSGVESLVRWTHPRHGALPPDRFIGPAEETGEIRALTEWVVRQALADQAVLAAEGEVLTFAINLSGRLVGDLDFTQLLLDRLAQAAGPITLEITETAMMDDFAAAAVAIARFSQAGLGVSIDDYGSGLSSLGYLKRIAASELKLDRSLVCDVATSGRDALVVRSTIDLAHSLGMKVVAEGVEDEVSLALLTGMGCDLIQGWRIARPMALDALRTFLAEQAGPTAKAVAV